MYFLCLSASSKLNNKSTYSPVDISNDIHYKQDIHISYQTAYCVKEKALASINRSYKAVYNNLLKYCEDILCTNPGSIAVLERVND